MKTAYSVNQPGIVLANHGCTGTSEIVSGKINDDTPWTLEELSPIKDITIMDITPTNSVLGAEITLVNGEKYLVDFKDVDGFKSCCP